MPPVAGTKTLIAAELDPVGAPDVFTTIGELNDTISMNMNRNSIEAIIHNSTVDRYIPSDIIRRDVRNIGVNYIYGNSTHAAMKNHFLNATTFKIRTRGPQGLADTDEVIESGFLESWNEENPIDDRRTAAGSFRPSGPFTIDGVEYGTEV